ncbi:MAG: 50S ribosomal protein L10 [Patescibacteria group bacterium]|nr:50S ribosomal protein L10 [Patescibacteria group bacterium]
MAKTKDQKNKAVEQGVENLKGSETVVLVDFTGLSVNKLNDFRGQVRAIGGVFRVVKKRLLKFVFEKIGMEFDPKNFEGQTGVVFSPKDVHETASTVYKFSKQEKGSLKILGGFNIKDKAFVESAEILSLGQLPSREVLLGQLVGMLSAPLQMLLYVLDQKSKMVENK